MEEALDGFVTLAKGQKGAGCAALIGRAISNKRVFVFGELLDEPNVAALADVPEHAPMLELLKIFAFGTYADYTRRRGEGETLPDLSEEQLTKLKQLSIVSMAHASKSLPYDKLMAELDVPDVRTLEDMVIECFYAGVVKGKLDQRARAVEVTFAMGRDVRPEQVEELIASLEEWRRGCDAASAALSSKLDAAASAATVEELRRADHKDAVERTKATVRAKMDRGEMSAAEFGAHAGMGMDDDDYEMVSHGARRGRAGKRRAGEGRHRP